MNREVVGDVHGKQVAACLDRYSLWVEISGPKGGNPWQMSPGVARILANALNAAADKAEEGDR